MHKDGNQEEKEVWVKEDKIHDANNKKNVNSGAVQKTETYWYHGITRKEERNLEKHIKVMASKCVMNQTRKKEIRVELKLFGTCLMTALTYGWIHGKIRHEEIRKIEKIQGKSLKGYFNFQLQQLMLIS